MIKIKAYTAVVVLLFSGFAIASESELKSEIQKLKEQNAAQAAEILQIQEQTKSLFEAREKPNLVESSPDTAIGGYGEINYNKYVKTNSRNQIDLTRFVFSMNHRFDDSLSFDGEMELEHAIASKEDDGEVEVEQAFLTYQFSSRFNVKTGLFLMPFGFLNPSHEPPVYYGVERNEIETRIIPSTWREGGMGVFGSTGFGVDWDLGVVTGFDVAKFDDSGSPLGAVHQELQLAKAQDLSLYGTVNYRLPGFVVGAGVFSGKGIHGNADFESDDANPNFSGINGRVTLADLHARWQGHGFDVQGLYARGKIGDASDINDAINTYNISNPDDERSFVPLEFYGWLVQAAYKFQLGVKSTLAPFVRYEEFDTQAKMTPGVSAEPTNKDKVITMGASFLPHPQVVFKADYQNYAENSGNSRFDLGMGYMF